MEITITDKDIEKAEKIFLNDGEHFDGERRKFIKYLDKSLYLQACPGSGKTTVLLAKLYILSEKMPFEDNKSICVLTHTNVAINLIKKKLGEKANKLLSYPNFFGTIQSFVDKYLTIRAYIEKFGYRPKFIDNNIFLNRLEKYGEKLSSNNWLKKSKGKYESVLEYVFNIEVDFANTDDNELFSLKISKLKDKGSKTYKILYNIFKKMFEDGYLRFSDALSLGYSYLNSNDDLKTIFSSRFKFVFIDEAQDTSSMQRKIIEKCFDENVIIQWLGDVNQSIMIDDFSESAWEPKQDHRYSLMYLNKSHRISQQIANILKTIAVVPEKGLQGTDISIKPKLIIFDDSQVGKVVKKFANIVSELKCNYNGEQLSIYEISRRTGNPIKAVGWVGKEKHNGLSIKSYYSNFEKNLTNNRKLYFPNLFTMYELSKNIRPKEFKERVLNCILEALHISNIKSPKGKEFSKTQFLKYIDEDLLNDFFAAIVQSYIPNNSDNFSILSENIINLLKQSGIQINNESVNYLTERKRKSVVKQSPNSNESNVYKKNNLKIDIDTVHNAKGETHTATLYLETFFYRNSLSYILNEIQGKQSSNSGDKKGKKKAQKIVYVAFSRPTHLLCVAMHKDEFGKLEKDNLMKYWDIDETLIKNAKQT